MTDMRTAIREILNGYHEALTSDFSDSTLASFIRRDAAAAVENAAGKYSRDLIFTGSAGRGRWAAVPWIAAFYPPITRSATRGYYLVYLFDSETQVCFLSLNQGTTAVVDELGVRRGMDVLQDRASIMRHRLKDFESALPLTKIRLTATSNLPRGYMAGHALGKEYALSSLPDEDVLRADLDIACRAYLALFYRGGISAFSSEGSEEAASDERDMSNATVDEVRKYRVHRSIERNPTAARKAKQAKPPVCEICGFSFGEFYGNLGSGYIEAHHLKPLSALQEGETISYDVASDFALLCANCHRMIHRLNDPSDTEQLRQNIQQAQGKAKFNKE